MTQAWTHALRRGSVPLVLGIICWLLSLPAIEDLDTLLKGLALILVVLGLVIVVATGRTLSAEARRAEAGSLAGRPAKRSVEG